MGSLIRDCFKLNLCFKKEMNAFTFSIDKVFFLSYTTIVITDCYLILKARPITTFFTWNGLFIFYWKVNNENIAYI